MNQFLYSYIKENKNNLSKNELLIREYILEHYGQEMSTKIISDELYIARLSVKWF